jgi:protein-S-isoprenylcysteine O-methyltransferase Ste14
MTTPQPAEAEAPVRQSLAMPPVYLLVAILVMIALDRWAPLGTFDGPFARAVGLLLSIAGLALVIWCTMLFQAAQTTIKPYEASSALVTRGPYRISRNPIYLGMVLFLAGLSLGLGSWSPFLVIPAFMFIIERRFIRAEEGALLRRFGDEYETYRGRVRRWI